MIELPTYSKVALLDFAMFVTPDFVEAKDIETRRINNSLRFHVSCFANTYSCDIIIEVKNRE